MSLGRMLHSLRYPTSKSSTESNVCVLTDSTHKSGKERQMKSQQILSLSVAREIHPRSALLFQISRVDGKGMGPADRVWHINSPEEGTIQDICAIVLTLRAVPK